MDENYGFVLESIIRDMSEGVITLGLNGVIKTVNPAAAAILERSAESLMGKAFAKCFFEYEENDAFNQTVLDSVYDPDCIHEGYVNYFTGSVSKQLHVTSSYLKDADKKIGVILVVSDITELTELRDAVVAMEQIKALNGKLQMRNKLLSETFGRFLSDDIVRQLLETPDGLALGGKKAELTIMMSDLRGFTAMSERMPAADLLSMLNHYLGEMTEIIQRNNGTIIEFIGDGIMAVFGAPNFSDRHASDAVAAALEMQKKMSEINNWNKGHGYPILEMGIGLNTGDVIVGNIGSEKRTKYGVTGSNVNLCGRIESYTVGGQVLASSFVLDKISEKVTYNDEISVKPKGVDKAISVFSVTGIGGPYGIELEEEKITYEALANPIHTEFFVIDGKHVGDVISKGEFTAICYDGGVLRTEAPLKKYDNIQLEMNGKLFGKVISANAPEYEIRFTSRPDGFDTFIKKEN